jgi:hypothetical protein
LPSLPTGKTLLDLINHRCQPCPHSDYGTIKDERDKSRQDNQNLQTQYNNEISEKDKKIAKLEAQLKAKDKIIAELRNKPPTSPVNNQGPKPADNKSEPTKSFAAAEQEQLLQTISQQQITIEKLQAQIKNKEIQELIKTIPVADLTTIQQLQAKIKVKETNLTQLRYLCLFGGIVLILLGLNTIKLLAKKTQSKNNNNRAS